MTAPQFLLVLEARSGDAALERVRAALDAVPIASAVIRTHQLGSGQPAADAATVKPLVSILQARGVAALIHSDIALARATGADGIHLVLAAGGPDPATVVKTARSTVGKGQIVGVEIASGLRHDAMIAGESGADYIAFSGPNHDALIAWWAELFELPCVALGSSGMGVADPHAAADLGQAGADFIAVALNGAQTPADIQTAMRAVAAALVRRDQA